MSLPSIPADLAHDWRQLTDLIEATVQRQDVPCHTGRIAPVVAWTSDDEAEQELAAGACRFCPVLVQCREYGIEHHKEAGVYGGLTHHQRRKAARQRRKK